MTANTTIILQILATILQVLNAINVSQLPVKWQAGVTGLLTVAQAVQGVVAHYYTPSGVLVTTGTTVTTPEVSGAQKATQ
jgi:hypothetical protein